MCTLISVGKCNQDGSQNGYLLFTAGHYVGPFGALWRSPTVLV